VSDLEANNAPEWEREQARWVGEELPGLEPVVPTETFDGGSNWTALEVASQ
jgi:hypothetical protein